MGLKLVSCSESEWDQFVERSPEGTLFVRSDFFRSHGSQVRFVQCLDEDGTILAGLAMNSEGQISLLPFQAYNGIIFSDLSHLKTTKRLEKRFASSELFALELFQRPSPVLLANHWKVHDMRPFDWLNYHEREKGFFRIGVRYTSLLKLDSDFIQENCNSIRLKSLKTATKMGLVTRESNDLAVLDRLHDLTFRRQEKERSPEECRMLQNLTRNLLEAGKGRLFLTYHEEKPASACFIGFDSKRAYYLFGASDPDFRKTESGTKILFDVFRILREELGLQEIDLVGVNSPERGGFKLGFGGDLVPYYTVSKETPREAERS